jgi:hypothetical protein
LEQGLLSIIERIRFPTRILLHAGRECCGHMAQMPETVMVLKPYLPKKSWGLYAISYAVKSSYALNINPL